jgi:predicted TIM-barrel fold metal-dependent hydrolase
MTIDFHAHWVPEELANALRKRSVPPHIAKSDTGEQFHMPVGGLPYDDIYSDLTARLEFMDAHEIQMQVLSLPCLFGLDSRPAGEALPLLTLFNDATSAAAKRAPDRFAGLASLPFDDIHLAAQEYRRARRELGLIGAIVPINYFLSIQGVEALQPLLDMAEGEGGHLFLHPGRRPDEAEAMDAAGTDRYPDSVMARRQLEIQHQVAAAMVTLLWGGFSDKYKGFTLHVANMGGTLPLVVERMDYTSRMRTHEPVLPSQRVRNSSVLVDCSSMGPIAIAAAVACFGAESILFGTDNPIYRSEWQLDAVRDANITDADRRAILHDNGARALRRWR